MSEKEAGSFGLLENISIATFWSPNAASSAAGVDPEGILVTTRLALSEQVAAERIGVWRVPAGCRTESTTAVGADVLNVFPNGAAEYDQGLGVPMGAAPLVGTQCEPVATHTVMRNSGGRSKQTVGVGHQWVSLHCMPGKHRGCAPA